MKRKLTKSSLFSIALILLGCYTTAHAQVGIGNPNPDSTSVLDLTNPNNRGLVLPPAVSTAGFSNTSTLGMTYFTNDHVYYKRSDGYNALTPWRYKFNGNVSEDVYYNSGGNIGIGSTNLSSSPEAPLQIETDNAIGLSGNGSFLIGTTSAANLVMNSGELQTRTAGSAAPLKINEDGGDVTFGANASPVRVQASDKLMELHRPTNTYFDLVPTGTIVMWFGDSTTVPAGWAFCDGGSYPRSDNSGNLTVPDLRGRFVVGEGSNGVSTYGAHATGGQDAVALTTNELPSHAHNMNHGHSIFDPGHSHSIDLDDNNGGGGIDDAGNSNDGSDNTATAFTGISVLPYSGNTGSIGANAAHENRPQYYSLTYIIKL